MKQSVLLILAFLLLQPVLDSFDVADHNTAINTTSQLLHQQSELDQHCMINNDHDTHQLQHQQLSQALADNADDAHCHVCHISVLFTEPWQHPANLPSYDIISLNDPAFNSRLLIPDLRPPIATLLS
ncbi:hypothetical protein RC083_08685 [Pseudoalteromonas haloplanktis]|uniref:DUF2946 domain-containing protein n=1 Tax=Pseudoalteromonas haloplanktis TaxID=228 RepID=A0ABU1BDQ7_PSEHA|nr:MULTISPECIES: hypothetical protein [Pseudoalteromonas]MDQ9091664.1 hypothetical protein [Pseudoalteromonas haloplanktis]TMN73186.1 hypothetical protein CWB85_03470 [Pseudoalteromonas sp. S1727]